MSSSSSPSSSSFSDLGPDTLFQIFEYLSSSLNDLGSLGLTNQSFSHFVFQDPRTDDLLFQGKKRRYWQNLYQLRILAESNNAPKQKPKGEQFHGLGILSETQEINTLAYDHPSAIRENQGGLCDDSDDDEEESMGYFGFQILPQAVAVWGDYAGISFVPSLGSFVAADDQQTRRTHGLSFADCFQVMAVCQEGVFLFLGFASGTIHCLNASVVNGNSNQEYSSISCNSQTHSNEITCLAKAGNIHLVSSGSRDRWSALYVHWNALRDAKLDRVSQIPLGASGPALSVASTLYDGQNMYVSYGARDGQVVVALWNEAQLENHTAGGRPFHSFFCPIADGIRGNVVYLAYMGETRLPQGSKRLVIGTSMGKLAVAKHREVGHRLDNIYTLENCCPGGCVEAVELVGSVLITAGGSQGKIRFWDWETGASLSGLQIHPGRLHHGRTKLRSAVVDMAFCHERSSFICLCRDGYVGEWSVQDEWQRSKKQTKKKRQRDTISNQQQDKAVMPLTRRSRRLSSLLHSSSS
jgi:hypothetical protein